MNQYQHKENYSYLQFILLKMVLCWIFLSCQTNVNAHEIIPSQIKKAALEDRATLPPSSYNSIYYLYLPTSTSTHKEKSDFNSVLRFVLASSSSNPILDYCLPLRLSNVTNTDVQLWRINLNNLQWSHEAFQSVLASYPYSYNNVNPLLIRADWLISQLTDTSTSSSQAYYRLLYNQTSEKLTRQAILKFWGVSPASKLSFGLVENNSGVAVSKTRIIENRPTLRGYTWGTRDSSSTDPLDDAVPPFTNFKHEAEEWIIGSPKFSLTTNPPIVGTLQYYFLSSPTGQVQTFANPAIVEDRSRFRDNSQIRAPGSCIQCHSQGINFPKQNALRTLIEQGADIYTDKKTQQALELFHLLPLQSEIEENNAKFQTIQSYLTGGMKPEEFLEAFKRVIKSYDTPLTLERAGKETNFATLQFALATVTNSTPTLQLDPRLVGLAHNIPISRQNWEKLHFQAITSIKLFKKEAIQVK